MITTEKEQAQKMYDQLRGVIQRLRADRYRSAEKWRMEKLVEVLVEAGATQEDAETVTVLHSVGAATFLLDQISGREKTKYRESNMTVRVASFNERARNVALALGDAGVQAIHDWCEEHHESDDLMTRMVVSFAALGAMAVMISADTFKEDDDDV